MEGLSSYVRIALTVALLQLLSGCQLQHDLSLRFDVSKLDKSQITDFKYSSHEEVQYYRNVVLGTSIKSLDLVYSNCSNDKILMTDRYVYFIENPSSASALEYQLKINLCGGAAIRPTKTWKISYSDIKKIEKYGARYKIYFQSESSPVEILFFKTYMYDGKAVEEVMKEMGNLEVSGMIDMSEIYDGRGGWSSYNCARLSNEWEEWQPQSPTFKNISSWNKFYTQKRPAFWKKSICITKSGIWSKDGVAADTIHAANDHGLLYVGSLEHGNNCGPYTSSWLSSEEYEYDVCKGNWKLLDGKHKKPCADREKIKLRRLAIGFDRCYLYGKNKEGYMERYSSSKVR